MAKPRGCLPAGEYVRNALSIRHPSLEHFCRSRTRPRNLATKVHQPPQAHSSSPFLFALHPTLAQAVTLRASETLRLSSWLEFGESHCWPSPCPHGIHAHSIHARACLSVTRLLSFSLSVTPHPTAKVGQGDRLSLQSLVFRIRPFEILGSVGRQCASVSCERAAPTLLLAAPVARSRPSGLPFASRAECCAGSHALAPRTLHRRITLRPKKKKKRCHLLSLFDSASPCMLVA